MKDKQKQRDLIIEIMKADEKSGIYTTGKQTAVDWLVMKWATQGTLYSADITHALEMEKEQLQDAFWEQAFPNYIAFEQYYKENYEQKIERI